MRTIGFIGIALLAIVNVFGFIQTARAGDWRGMALMLFIAGLLAFFAHHLRRGAKLERGADSGEVLAQGWAGQPVSVFLREQVAKSIEGRILIIGSVACLIMAVVAALAPGAIALAEHRAATHATLFGLWPLVAFVAYVKVCGPRYETSAFSVLMTAAWISVPFILAYK